MLFHRDNKNFTTGAAGWKGMNITHVVSGSKISVTLLKLLNAWTTCQ